MVADIAAIFCCAYIVGLLLTGIPGTLAAVPISAIVSLSLGGTIALLIRRFWQMAPARWVWLTAGLIGAAASFYFQHQLPQPSSTDLCHWAREVDRAAHCLPQDNTLSSESITLIGIVQSPPRLTRSDRLQFELAAESIELTQPFKQSTPPATRQIAPATAKQTWQTSTRTVPSLAKSPSPIPSTQTHASVQTHAKKTNQTTGNAAQVKSTQTGREAVSSQPPAQITARRQPQPTAIGSSVRQTDRAIQKSPEETPERTFQKTSERTLERIKTQQSVNGNVYVTIPPIAGEQLYPGLRVSITGSLYQPQPAANPGGFNFAQYLQQRGIFTGLIGDSLVYPADRKPAPPLFWAIRQRITQIQERGLSNPEAALVSAMVMGKAAVDVPYPIQDQFKQTGLAHALAASGTQVSLLLGVVLALTARCSNSLRVGIGLGTLILYLGLTGAEASILRAGIMGGATLFALWFDRQIKPVGLLLVAATLLLLWNPLWIWDLGLQLSFLATLGLLITLPHLSRWLDWLPTPIATLFAVPIAATIWTLPILLAGFGVLSPYSILVNVIVSPFITIVSIGGMISAVAAFVHPYLGSSLAGLLYFPAHFLLQVAAIASHLPGNLFAVGTLQIWQTLLLYSLILLLWRWDRLHRYWWIGGLIGLIIVAIPASYRAATLTQITVLTGEHPMLVIQDRGRTGLIYSGSVKDVQFTLLPFLQRQGVNHLNWAIAPRLGDGDRAAWQKISAAQPIDLFYSTPTASARSTPLMEAAQPDAQPDAGTFPTHDQLLKQIKSRQGMSLPLAIGRPLQLGDVTIEYHLTKPEVFSIQVGQQHWLWFDGVPALPRQLDLKPKLAPVEAIGWSGKSLHPDLLADLHPQVGIVWGKTIDPATAQRLRQHQVKIHSLDAEGALQWNPSQGFFTAAPN
ncbi:MAG: ComEC/Rec2 family competence protein [Elainella sp. Prado103]|nr:ComEC/Rec2 family competence protein [Elainella sp. Prado103]